MRRRNLRPERKQWTLVFVFLLCGFLSQTAFASEYHFRDIDEQSIASGFSKFKKFLTNLTSMQAGLHSLPGSPHLAQDAVSSAGKTSALVQKTNKSFETSTQNRTISSVPVDSYASFNVSPAAPRKGALNSTKAKVGVSSGLNLTSAPSNSSKKAKVDGDDDDSKAGDEVKSEDSDGEEPITEDGKESEQKTGVPKKTVALKSIPQNIASLNSSAKGKTTVQQASGPGKASALGNGNIGTQPSAIPLKSTTNEPSGPVGVLKGPKKGIAPENTGGRGNQIARGSFSISTNITAIETLLTVLEHELFTNGERFCYFQGICRLGDGTFLLPSWMEKLSGLVSQCGIEKVIYSFHNASFGAGNSTLRFASLPRGNINISDTYKNFDIIGGRKPRAEHDLLITDLTPTILLSDMFKRPSAYKNFTKASCFKATGNCHQHETYPGRLNPAILVDSALSDVKDYLWPKGILRLLRNGFEGSLETTDLQDVYGWRFRSHASCFKSLLITNATVESFKPSAILRDNFVFEANSLSREPVARLEKPDARRCDLKVLIMNQFQKGHIVGVQILEKAIRLLNRALIRKFPHTSVQAETVYFQNSSFHEQIAVMQEADLVVASHSASNANLAFLRPRTFFLELLPFGVRPDAFRAIARAYDVDYHFVHAEPDTMLFAACVAHYNTEAEEQAGLLMRQWNASAAAYVNATRARAENGKSAYFLPAADAVVEDEQYSELRNVRDCANLQRLSVDIKHLARTVMTRAAEQCGIRSEPMQSAVFAQFSKS